MCHVVTQLTYQDYLHIQGVVMDYGQQKWRALQQHLSLHCRITCFCVRVYVLFAWKMNCAGLNESHLCVKKNHKLNS